jgi:hypothetical protein
MATKIKGEPVHLLDDDVVVLKREHNVMYQQCCDCGLVHRIEASPRSEDVRLRFVRVGNAFPLDEFTPETEVEFAAGQV